MNPFSFLKYFLCVTFSFLIFSAPVFAGANVAVKGEGDEVPSYVRSNITGFDFHGEDLHLSSIAGAVARDADFSEVDLHGTTLTLSDLKGIVLTGATSGVKAKVIECIKTHGIYTQLQFEFSYVNTNMDGDTSQKMFPFNEQTTLSHNLMNISKTNTKFKGSIKITIPTKQ